MNIHIEDIVKMSLGPLREYSDGSSYRDLEIKTEKGNVTITLNSEDEAALHFKL